jgi:hypothetical protein
MLPMVEIDEIPPVGVPVFRINIIFQFPPLHVEVMLAGDISREAIIHKPEAFPATPYFFHCIFTLPAIEDSIAFAVIFNRVEISGQFPPSPILFFRVICSPIFNIGICC